MVRTLVLAPLAGLFLTGSALAAEPLVDVAWLQANLDNEEVVVLDLREPAKKGAPDPYLAGRIPGAVAAPYTGITWRTISGGIPGMLPSEAEMEGLLGRLGVEEDDHLVVVSDGLSSSDFGTAARVFWTLEVMGHDRISLLEGGHAGWVAAGGALETGPAPAIDETLYDATFDPTLVATLEDVKAAAAAGLPLVDARPAGQYTGAETPKNVGIAGTIPGAVSLPHDVLVLKGNQPAPPATLARLRASVGVPEEGPQIAFCNTGHWASVGWFMLNKVGGNEQVRLYDGSMVEWAKAAGQPTETSAKQVVTD